MTHDGQGRRTKADRVQKKTSWHNGDRWEARPKHAGHVMKTLTSRAAALSIVLFTTTEAFAPASLFGRTTISDTERVSIRSKLQPYDATKSDDNQ
eukprot:scaffold16073_cov75-Cyclotella_meneghiniana.AAC.1